MKTCTKCGEAKSVIEFNKDVSKRDGLRLHCKTCVSIANATWKAANKDRVKAGDAAWHLANRDKKNAYSSEWAKANTERHKATKAAWYAANPDASRIHTRNRRAVKRSVGGKLSKGLAEKLFKLQRGKCACGCKQPLGDDYHLDHRMPLALGGENEDWNIQILRKTCNLQKHAKHPNDFMRQRGFLL